MRVEDGFQPTPYSEGNPYSSDPVLPNLLKRLFPSEVRRDVDQDLLHFGDLLQTKIRDISARTEPPKLVQYDQWGRRIDDLQTSEGWRGLKAAMQEEGLIGIFYERRYREYSRVYGFAKMMLAVGDTRVIFCPLSMTDGCARVLELLGTPALKRDVIPRLISRDPKVAFTAGQWMTEVASRRLRRLPNGDGGHTCPGCHKSLWTCSHYQRLQMVL
ncbi:hypothetical protein K474DRAFT_1242013 [Panus rudis PR-1116 ss-1]|nr:hypothetical protein K474DRAFT_1242013 [Panus rudis PR-1116 ss-1]